MLGKRVKYICYYDDVSSGVQRNYVLSATNKLNYIFACCNQLGFGVDIISASEGISPALQYHKREKKYRGENTLQLFATIGGHKFAIARILNRWLVLLQLFVYLLCHTKRGECCIVYHSLGYSKLLWLVKKLKKLVYIGEIEEVYQDVSSFPKRVRKSEYQFIECCDKYIFPTELLDEKLNPDNKPSVIIYGTYMVEKQRSDKFADGKIHVVYAGTFDVRKGGAAAAAAATYLPTNYHVHICGFGNAEEVATIRGVIEANQSFAHAQLTYDGLKKGDDYIKFIQSCHVGLSVQDPSAAFNMTSFPSKILSYMSNGLAVVSINIEAIKRSKIGPYLHYYSEQTPENIAKAVISCDVNFDGRECISSLSRDFIANLRQLLHD